MNIEILKDLFSAFNIILLFYILGERMEKRVTKKLRLVLGLVIAIMLSIIENSLHTHIIYSFCYNNSDYLQKARKYGHFTGYKN